MTGRCRRIESARTVGGGSISPAARIEIDGGEDLFLKWNAGASSEMFEAEADGLRALAAAAPRPLRIPEVVGVGTSADRGASWILMEFVEPGPGTATWGEDLGHALAALHEPAGAPCGWRRDNFIGSLPQANPRREDWGSFYREHRIRPQLEAARERGHLKGKGSAVMDELVERIPELLGGEIPGGASMLHGDLWGGNVFPDTSGRPVLIDPAVYHGDPEVDLAMSELFGFPSGFLAGYRDTRTVDEGYERVRRDLYQLYYLLVHVVLFGAGYESACLRAARNALAAAS